MKIEKQGNLLVVTLIQKDMADPIGLHAEFERLILEEGYRRIGIDLAGVRDLQSLQLGCLVGLHLLAYENATILTFDNVSQRVRMLFKLIGLETLLEFHSPQGQKKKPGSL
jgi:anti-anti-sigma regulatory factor